MKRRMLVTTGNNFDGYDVTEYLGVVRGIVVRATGIIRGLRGIFATFTGTNVRAFEEVCEEARAQARPLRAQAALQPAAMGCRR